MRFTAYFILFTGVAFAQNLTEFSAAAAGGSIGGASGKKVSDGLTSILGKVGEQTAKAAGKEEKQPPAPALTLGPGMPKADTGGVPLPPALAGKHATEPQLPVGQMVIPREATQLPTLASVAPALPPPPEMTRQDLQSLAAGMSRADLLRLGAPASKITMFDDGHVSETYSYRQNGQKLGTVKLIDGAVASIDAQ